MAYKWIGLDAYNEKLDAFSREAANHLGQALYVGVNVVANGIKSAIREIPTRNDMPIWNVEKDGAMDTLTVSQKNSLIEGFGVTRHELKNGSINSHIGVHGYNKIKTKKFPQGQPNALVLRSYNSGSSVMRAHHIIDKVVKATKQACIDAMQGKLDEIYKEGD